MESLFNRCIDQDSVNKLCITDHDSLARFLKTRQLCYLFCQLQGSKKIANSTAATRLQITPSFNKMKIQPTAYLIGFQHDEAITSGKQIYLKKVRLNVVASGKSHGNDKLPNN